MGLISPDTFPLPTLGSLIKDIIAKEIYQGRGFAILRGIPVKHYTRVQNIIVHAGLSSWLGHLRGRQDPNSNVVFRHIISLVQSGADKSIGTAQYTGETICSSYVVSRRR